MAKKLALELGVSMDELVSDEDMNDIQIKYGNWRSEKIKSRLQLQEERKKVQNLLEIIGSIYMGISILGLRPEVQIPIWITIMFACVVIPLTVIYLMISKTLGEI